MEVEDSGWGGRGPEYGGSGGPDSGGGGGQRLWWRWRSRLLRRGNNEADETGTWW